MAGKTNKKSYTNNKRLPKGQRTYIRRLKQIAVQEGTVYRAPIITRVPDKTDEK